MVDTQGPPYWDPWSRALPHLPQAWAQHTTSKTTQRGHTRALRAVTLDSVTQGLQPQVDPCSPRLTLADRQCPFRQQRTAEFKPFWKT